MKSLLPPTPLSTRILPGPGALAAGPPRAERLASRWLSCALVFAVGLLGVAQASAQYIPDIGAVEGAEIPAEEKLDQAYDEARWRLGTLKIEPFIGLRDASIVSNQDPQNPDDDDTDFTATVGAGLRLYAKPSSKVIFAAHALPDYVWWQDDSDRSRLNVNLGLGVFGHLNRVNFEVSARRIEQQRFFSSEVPILSTTERDLVKAAIEFEVSRGIRVYAVARDLEVTSSDEDAPLFARVDREEQRVAVGIRLESRRGLWADVAYEDSEVEFAPTARPLSNEGTTIGVAVGLDRNRFSGSVRVAFRDLEPLGADSIFVPLDDVTGSAELLWQPRRNLGFVAFARRGQSYALDLDQSYFIADRYGLTARFGLGQAYFQVTGAVGEDDYESAVGSDRLDDVEEVSAVLAVPVRDLLVISLQGSITEYDSNLPGFDRDVTAYGVNIQLGSIAEKLRLGRVGGDW
ncbi:MAG: hypothetical protein AAGM22_00570 [Acidobacteriota bacterium]